MQTSSVSVIIPAHNEEAYVAKALESLKRQSIRPSEVIVVCNNCADQTATVAKRFYPSAKIVEKTYANVSRARNDGAKIAQGELLLFLDADATLEKTALASLIKAARKENCPIVGTFLIKNDQGAPKDRVFNAYRNLAHHSGRLYFASGAIACSRSVFKKVGGFDEALHAFEDIKFINQALEQKAEYTLVKDYAMPSMRRYETMGYWENLSFYIKNGVKVMLGRIPDRPKPVR